MVGFPLLFFPMCERAGAVLLRLRALDPLLIRDGPATSKFSAALVAAVEIAGVAVAVGGGGVRTVERERDS